MCTSPLAGSGVKPVARLLQAQQRSTPRRRSRNKRIRHIIRSESHSSAIASLRNRQIALKAVKLLTPSLYPYFPSLDQPDPAKRPAHIPTRFSEALAHPPYLTFTRSGTPPPSRHPGTRPRRRCQLLAARTVRSPCKPPLTTTCLVVARWALIPTCIRADPLPHAATSA